MTAEPVLSVQELRTEFRTEAGVVTAVDGINLSVRPGEVLGLVGESGSGKSVTGYSILGLIDPPGRIAGGRVMLRGQDVLGAGEDALRAIRGNRIAMIFQDPMSSLHPMLTIAAQMTDAILAHRVVPRRQAWAEAREALVKVGISAPEERLSAYPHQLSGGMRQRVAIATAMLNRPDVIIADEPTTGLDVTIQAQILSEVQALAAESGMAMIWITHDLAVVASLAHRIAVMYAGSIVEEGSTGRVIERPAHPYTAGLLASAPSRNRTARRLPQIPGGIASAAGLTGCRFLPRCSRAGAGCEVLPPLAEVAPGHAVRCVHPIAHAAPRCEGAGHD